jgi:hypothetical protein
MGLSNSRELQLDANRDREVLTHLREVATAVKSPAAATHPRVIIAEITPRVDAAQETAQGLVSRHAALKVENAALKAQIPASWPKAPSIVVQHMKFDPACAAATNAKVALDEDASGTGSATVKEFPHHCVTLWGAAPLQRPQEQQQQQAPLPSYCIIVTSYDESNSCHIGFVPATALSGDVNTVIRGIPDCGGWYIEVAPETFHPVQPKLRSGWVPLRPENTTDPRNGITSNRAFSAYATTAVVPPVPMGGAVQFAVDHAAGTCRAAFYMPMTVTGGFVEPPYATMELRFVATEADHDSCIPSRSVPTADSGVGLFPAVTAIHVRGGASWQFASPMAP